LGYNKNFRNKTQEERGCSGTTGRTGFNKLVCIKKKAEVNYKMAEPEKPEKRVGEILNNIKQMGIKLNKEIIIPPELLKLFKKDPIRIIDIVRTPGMWPIDPWLLEKFKKMMPELFNNRTIMKKFDVALTYKGNTMKADLAKIGIDLPNRIWDDWQLQGFFAPPKPILMKKAGINQKKFKVFLVPKGSIK
jgi:hypothetical protein